jgi:hypothetical protein
MTPGDWVEFVTDRGTLQPHKGDTARLVPGPALAKDVTAELLFWQLADSPSPRSIATYNHTAIYDATSHRRDKMEPIALIGGRA